MILNSHSLGVGMYSRAEVARLLKMTPSRVSRWVRGYSYWLRRESEERHRKQPPVVTTRLRELEGVFVLSFLDLMELRVIRALVDEVGLSLQQIRAAAKMAMELFHTRHPFATHRVFYDTHRLFAPLSKDAVIELTSRNQQLISVHAFEPYLKEVDFDTSSGLANRWWPLGKDVPIVLDPHVAFGAPVLAGTATRTDVVATLAQYVPHEEAARAYAIELGGVRAAVEFENELRAAA
jgi:uncharacterized protein (DUF433 family)